MIVCRSVRVGKLAAGWSAGAQKLGVKLPAWIARHDSTRSSAAVINTFRVSRIILTNAVKYVTNVESYDRRIQSAINYSGKEDAAPRGVFRHTRPASSRLEMAGPPIGRRSGSRLPFEADSVNRLTLPRGFQTGARQDKESMLGIAMSKPRKDKTPQKKTVAIAPATAAPQALGYGLQYTRLTAMLLEAPAHAVCSMEVLDDVAQEMGAGEQRFVQSKSSLGDNPVAGRAASLWKTIFNWLQLVRGGFVNLDKAIFELYVSRPVTGKLVAQFAEADAPDKAKAALAFARRELWGEAPEFPLKKELREDLARYVNPVLQADDAEVAPIIVKMRLVCGSGSPQSDIETIIRGHPVSSAKVQKIADHMCGWVKRRVDQRLEQSLPAVIACDDFHAAYVSFCRAIDRDTILRGLARKPTEPEKLERLPDVFVQQLGLIEVPFEDQLGAISDFLRAYWDRVHWAKVGDVDESSFDELDESLRRAWSNHTRANEIEHRGKSRVDRGQLLYSNCMQYSATVQGMVPPSHFIPGCFHRLADETGVGWHPDYQALLRSALSSV